MRKFVKFIAECLVEVSTLTIANQLILGCDVVEGLIYAGAYVMAFHVALLVFVVGHNVIFRKRERA